MHTYLDEICDLISELDIGETEANKLLDMMIGYKRDYAAQLRHPTVRKLWDAIEEATRLATGRKWEQNV